MNYETIPEEATQLTMEYTLYYTISLPENLVKDNIKHWWVKYGFLMIEMNDGTIIETDSEAMWDDIEWKRGHRNLRWQDDEYYDIESDLE
jgi:hypothetical protein